MVLSRIENATPLEASNNGRGGYRIKKIDDHTVYKSILDIDDPDPESDKREILAMLCVRAYTTIPVPRVHVTVYRNEYVLAVMDFIQGERLDELWPKLSLWRKLGIAWTLRSYVRQLRRIPLDDPPRPGPLGPSPRRCHGLQFFRGDAGPFSDTEEFYQYIRRYTLGICPEAHEDNYTDGNLVFTHNDLNMRNVLVSGDGTVWLIDWDWSGFYPPYFEHIAAALAAYNAPGIPWMWKRCVPFITDPFFTEARFLTAP